MWRKRALEWIGGLVVVGLILLGVGGWQVRRMIQSGVDHAAAEARAEHVSLDTVSALIAVVDSESKSLRSRNRAVWALGQLRDHRALPVLEKHYTGGECDHSRRLCQRELKKALELSRGDVPNFLVIRDPQAE